MNPLIAWFVFFIGFIFIGITVNLVLGFGLLFGMGIGIFLGGRLREWEVEK